MDTSWQKKAEDSPKASVSKSMPIPAPKKIDTSWMNKAPDEEKKTPALIEPKKLSDTAWITNKTEPKPAEKPVQKKAESSSGGNDFKAHLEAMLAKGPRKPAASMMPGMPGPSSSHAPANFFGSGTLKPITEEEK